MSKFAVIEHLEGRQLFSKALGPSAVEGNFKGSAVSNDKKTVIPFKLIIESNFTEIIVGSLKVKKALTAKQFLAIRQGTYDEVFKSGSTTIVLTGTVTKAGMRISGPGKLNGAAGVFALTKYSS